LARALVKNNISLGLAILAPSLTGILVGPTVRSRGENVNWKKFVTDQGVKLIQDPRFMKLVQDERVMQAAMQVIQLRGKINDSIDQSVDHIARKLNLATKKEIRDLKRALSRVEEDLRNAKTKIRNE
jgi:hypothetical protein